jgi:hypothetical protein
MKFATTPAATILILLSSALAHAGTLTVTNTNDNLAGSLRQMIQDANSGDTIVFNIPVSDLNYNGATRVFTIKLTSGQLIISKNLTIDGGGQRITIQRNFEAATRFRIFDITAGTVSFSRLTIASGDLVGAGGTGGGIRNAGLLTLLGCTVRDNFSGNTQGGGIYNANSLTVRNCTFANNNAGIGNNPGEEGGAIFNGGTLIVSDSTFDGNRATVGAGLCNRGTARLGNTIVVRNADSSSPRDLDGSFTSDGYNLLGDTSRATGFPNTGDQIGASFTQAKLGPLQDNGGPTFTMQPTAGSVAIDQGKRLVGDDGVALDADQRGRARPVDNPMIQNAVGGDGNDVGAVEVDAAQTGPNFVVNTIDEHTDGVCGVADCSLWEAVNASNANTLDNSVISFAAGLSGTITFLQQSGGMNITRPVSIVGPGSNVLTLTGANSARHFNITTAGVSISNLQFSFGTSANSNGGSIVATNGVTLTNCVFANNRATGGFAAGGAVSNTGGVTQISDCTFNTNQAGFSGGAVYNVGGTVTIARSTFAGNTSGAMGGAIRNTGTSANATLNLINCTFNGNASTSMSSSASTGGAIGNLSGGGFSATITVKNCTLAGNSALTGGGIYTHHNPDGGPAFVTLDNTLFKTGSAGSNLAAGSGATITSQGYNLSNDDGSGYLTASGDKINTDPLLDPAGLAQNGGLTATIALQSSSPAIDAGNSSLTNDQRSVQRPYDFSSVPNPAGSNGSDIGAFELQPVPTPTPSPTPTATPTAIPATLGNISTRLRVETGDNVLIGGFIVTGTQPKKVIVRAIGTSLPLADKLANPTLELHGPNGLIEANDNWVDSPNKQAIIDSTIPPTSDLESAIVATLPANGTGYTAIVRGVNNSTGIGVVEAYDLDTTVDSKLANISTRGFVQTGDNVLIAGTIVVGQTPQKVIVRAIGPSLPIAGRLENPTMELRDQNGGLLEANDNWVDSPNKQAIIDSTIPPTNDLESAIVATLPAAGASYTAIVRGVNDTTGIAVVEVYALN